jgi:hypothetical protein
MARTIIQSISFHLYEGDDEAEQQAVLQELSNIPGVHYVHGDHETKIFAVQWSEPATLDDIKRALAEMHYTPDYP